MENRLGQETSPYLRQHADNPVHWHPWDEQALRAARDADKPILLSVGYSACHWCHVMAHESFEDAATADLMNELYVNIKVDREERPDIDRIYQIAHQMFTGRGGGWPLTVFLTPDEHLPIFAGTYFPKSANYGMPAFKDVLTRVESYYRVHLPDIEKAGQSLLQAFARLEGDAADVQQSFNDAPIHAARQRLLDSFDNRYGGFGGAPKFPHPSNLDLLLEESRRATHAGEADAGAWQAVSDSLWQMARRGLYDHLGGGFFRYCVDERWEIPHFEKMLYDNAALLASYSDAYATHGTPLFGEVAAATADWLLRDMQHEAGGFYSTLDADSEGEEGKFYVWRAEDFDAVLPADERDSAKEYFGLSKAPNFESKLWHLQVDPTVSDESRKQAARWRAALLEARERRVWPARDEKLLVAWNGMAIGALAKASRHLKRPDLAAAARRATELIRRELWDGGRLKAAYKDGRARFTAYLDDYAFLAQAMLELLQTDWSNSDLAFSVELADTMLEHFADPRGGFFFTADDHEQLIHRPKPLADEAIPSGNGIAALALTELGHLIGEPRYLDAAAGTLRAAQNSIEQYPEAHATLLRALRYQLEPPELVVVRAHHAELEGWRSALTGYWGLSFLIPDDAGELTGTLTDKRNLGSGTAYVCRGLACSAPITDVQALKSELFA